METMVDSAGVIWTADRMWFWDGSAWCPATTPPPPEPPLVALQAGSGRHLYSLIYLFATLGADIVLVIRGDAVIGWICGVIAAGFIAAIAASQGGGLGLEECTGDPPRVEPLLRDLCTRAQVAPPQVRITNPPGLAGSDSERALPAGRITLTHQMIAALDDTALQGLLAFRLYDFHGPLGRLRGSSQPAYRLELAGMAAIAVMIIAGYPHFDAVNVMLAVVGVMPALMAAMTTADAAGRARGRRERTFDADAWAAKLVGAAAVEGWLTRFEAGAWPHPRRSWLGLFQLPLIGLSWLFARNLPTVAERLDRLRAVQ